TAGRPNSCLHGWPAGVPSGFSPAKRGRSVRLQPDQTRHQSVEMFECVSSMKATANNTHETDQHLAGKDAITKARALLPSFRTAMLVTKSADNGDLRMRPM